MTIEEDFARAEQPCRLCRQSADRESGDTEYDLAQARRERDEARAELRSGLLNLPWRQRAEAAEAERDEALAEVERLRHAHATAVGGMDAAHVYRDQLKERAEKAEAECARLAAENAWCRQVLAEICSDDDPPSKGAEPRTLAMLEAWELASAYVDVEDAETQEALARMQHADAAFRAALTALEGE